MGKIKYDGLKASDITKQLKDEYAQMSDFFRAKRQKRATYNRDYANISNDNKTVYVRLLYATVQTLLAIHYTDKMTATFNARKVSSDEIAQNIQNLSEFDHSEMGRDKAYYWILFDTLMYGSAFEVQTGWDAITKKPTRKLMNPQMALVSQHVTDDGPSFYQFECYIDENELLSMDLMNMQALKTKIEAMKNRRSTDTAQYDDQSKRTRLLNPQMKDGRILVSYNFSNFWGKKCYSMTAFNHDVILEFDPIKAVMEEEKKDDKYICYPVVQYQFRPVPRDVMGLCIGDMLSDKQRALQVLANIDLILAQQNAFGDVFLVNSSKVKISQLTGPKPLGPRYVPIKKGSQDNLNDMVVPMPKTQLSQDTQVVKQQLEQQAKLDIALDERTAGISGDSSITATENQRVQMNSNLRQSLNVSIFMRGVKKFWKLWYRSYYENFKFSDEKNIRINSQFGLRPITVKRRDITTVEDIDIEVVAKSDLEAKRMEQKVSFYTILELMLNDPTVPNISKLRAKRKYARLNGLDAEEAKEYFPPTPEEVQATMDLEMINQNELPEIRTQNEDHMTYIRVYSRAIETEAKQAALDMRWRLYKDSRLQPLAPPPGAGGSSVMNQMANSMIQNNGMQTESLQSLQPTSMNG